MHCDRSIWLDVTHEWNHLNKQCMSESSFHFPDWNKWIKISWFPLCQQHCSDWHENIFFFWVNFNLLCKQFVINQIEWNWQAHSGHQIEMFNRYLISSSLAWADCDLWTTATDYPLMVTVLAATLAVVAVDVARNEWWIWYNFGIVLISD